MTLWTELESMFMVVLSVIQADGNRPGDYMHSGMRGDPHVGAFRRCSFTKTESDSNRSLRASPVSHLLVSMPTGPKVTQFPSVLQLFARVFQDRPLTKLIPSQGWREGTSNVAYGF